MVSTTDLLLISYPLFMTCKALKAPKTVKKQQFVEIAQIWYVVTTALLVDSITFGMMPFIDTFKSTLVLSVCLKPTRTAAYDSSRYINRKMQAAVMPILKKTVEFWPQIKSIFEKVSNLPDTFTETWPNMFGLAKPVAC